MKKLIKTRMSFKIRSFCLACFILATGGEVFSQQTTTVLPNNASYSNKTSPQGGLRYQRGFYLVTPAEMNSSGITSGMNINAIGFTIGRAQSDTTQGRFRLFLQNTADVVSRADTGWNTVNAATNVYHATNLFPGKYEWQVRANCTGSSAFTSSVFFSNDELSGCNNPYNLEAVAITTTGATLTWEAAASTAFVNYRVEYTATDLINWVSATTTDTFYVVTALDANKSYQWRVRTVCASDSSAINSSSFYTNAVSNCNLPSGLSASVSQDTLAALSWNAAAGALYYQVQFRRKGTTGWSTTSSFTNTASLDLELGTTYEWQVQTICDPGPSGSYVAGADITTGGATVCYEPIVPTTRNITDSSARLTWTPVVGATGYTIRYRLKNTISWTNAVTPMTLACDSVISVPDTTGAYDIPFHNGSPFTYTGGGVYVAWEYARPAGALSSTNLTLSTSRGTSIAGANGQDSVTYLLCMLSRADTNMTALPEVMGESRQRPETRFGSPGLQDSVEVIAVHALGKTIPKFQSPTPIAALITNKSARDTNYNVTLTVKSSTGAVRYSSTQNVPVTATDTARVVFNGWSPSVMGRDSIIISIPAQGGENVVNNNNRVYMQDVNPSQVAYDDGTAPVSAAGFGTGAGLLLNRHSLSGCGQVIAARAYLTASAEGKPLYAVIRDTSGAIVAQSASFTPGSGDINKYHAFNFPTPAPFSNVDFYIGIAQAASATAYYPVGAQWEDAQTRDSAYFNANLDGTNLSDHPAGGRLMIIAEVTSAVPEVFIDGNLVLCSGGSNVLTAGSKNVRYANSVIGYSSQYAATDYSAAQVLGAPDVFPAYGLSPKAWVSASAQDQREYLVLGFPNPGKINFVDIYETVSPGAVDSIWVKNASNIYELVYSTTAAAAPETARRNHISFTETAFDVSEIRIALNSPAVPGYNGIDAVGIGRDTLPGLFSSYLWSPGGETTATKTVTAAGIYTVTVTDGSGCSSSASVTITDAVTTPPVITAGGATALCPGDSVTLTSNMPTGNVWSNGATTQSITVGTAGNYSVTYDDGSGCGTLQSNIIAVTINPVPTATITGNTQICLGNQNQLDAGAGHSSYLWSTGETTQTIMISTAGVYSVRVTNSSGCSDTASVIATYVTLAAPTITGNLSFCPGSSTTLDAGAGYSSYLWSTGATTQTISVSTGGTFEVTVTNAGGCTASSSVVTTPFTAPVPVISGAAGFCAGGSTTLSVAGSYNSYQWSTGSTASSINVNTAGTYTVTVTDANGCTGSASVQVVQFASPTPTISGTLSFCGGTSTTLNAGPGYSSYLWSTGATTQTIVVSTVGTFSVTVTDANGCTGSASVNTSTTGALPASPGPITGPTTSSCNSNGHVYSISAVPNTSHYVWTVPAGATIAAGQGSTSITVNYSGSFQGGYIIVAASNACGQSATITERKLFVQALANQPGAINGQAAGVCGPTTKPYSIAAVPGATSYTWYAPAGATVVSGQTTNAVMISFSAGFTFGNICVVANNACGSTAPSCLQVSGASAMPGAVRGPTTVCKNQSNVMYEIDPVPGATSYTWTVPQSAQISFGQGTTNIVMKMGTMSGNITVRANSACGTGPARTLAITVANCFYAPPIVTMPELRPVPEVVSSYGGMSQTGDIYFEWTMGEPRVEAVMKPNFLFTQGFHQPLVYTIPVKQTDTAVLVSSDKLKITAYPNPVSTVLSVQVETAEVKPVVLELVDLNGRLLQRRNLTTGLNKNTVEFQMATYIGGSYFLMVRDMNGTIINTIKLVKVD